MNVDKLNPPLVSNEQVTSVQLDAEDQADDEETVCYDRRRRGRVLPERVENEVLDIFGQVLAFLQGIPSAVEEDVT